MCFAIIIWKHTFVAKHHVARDIQNNSLTRYRTKYNQTTHIHAHIRYVFINYRVG